MKDSTVSKLKKKKKKKKICSNEEKRRPNNNNNRKKKKKKKRFANAVGMTRGRDHGGRRPSSDEFSQSNRHSTIGTRQTEYHEALPSSVNDEVRCDCTSTDDVKRFMILGLSSADGGMAVGL